MAAYVLRRVGGAVGVLWAAFTVSYLILYLLPSDPVAIMLDQGAGGERVDALDRTVADAAFGGVEDAPHRDLVSGVGQRAQVRERVAHLGADALLVAQQRVERLRADRGAQDELRLAVQRLAVVADRRHRAQGVADDVAHDQVDAQRDLVAGHDLLTRDVGDLRRVSG